MKVEVLYFQGCPNHEATVDRVRAVLADEGVSADLAQIEVKDVTTADSLGFLGSPTVRINGMDVEAFAAGTGPVGLSCRTYRHGSVWDGAPPVETIRHAVRGVKTRSNSDEAL